MNKVILIGRLTRDPELTTTASGINVCKMSIAVNRPFENAEGEREADFFNVVAWRGLADNCAKFLSKGKKVGVVGRLQSRNYEDKDGNKRYVIEVMADEVEFLTPHSDGERQPTAPPKAEAKKKAYSELKPVDSEDLPF